MTGKVLNQGLTLPAPNCYDSAGRLVYSMDTQGIGTIYQTKAAFRRNQIEFV